MGHFLTIVFVLGVIAAFMAWTSPSCDPGYVPTLSSPNLWACVMAQPKRPQ